MRGLQAEPADFSPPLLRIQERPPAPLAGWMLRTLVALVAGVLLWAAFGPLDIVAVADGKLVPSGYLKIVQPAEQGIVREILVREGEQVSAGQILIRMDPVLNDADMKAVQAEYHNKRLALRRSTRSSPERASRGRGATRRSSRPRSKRSTRRTCAPTRTRSRRSKASWRRRGTISRPRARPGPSSSRCCRTTSSRRRRSRS
jgi:multidrug efflux pump subunit AcrA (membrane-fusion protein)